ncbi:MAG: sigma-E processing peptidase SpoIIGA [Oscillospiraceae bacterium]|nr:sigma-E processing peptidase SpoIIGA [Oscillospiraceae bacterium]MDD3833750.1 sigma-E processing peptidase SpoIIGA [Oscillospiraceae bacterium]MDD4545864.1 sigma-E processing peptidase SpoIIGA [Oscillospiraceae bacterium]
MPVIYIDVLLALNLFIDFLLLSLVRRVLRIPSKRLRIVLGSLVGSASSCLLFLPDIPSPLSFLIKMAFACVIVRIAFAWKGALLYIKQIAVFLISSTIFAGLSFAIWFFAAPTGFYVVNGVVYYNVSPVVLTALTVICYFVITIYDKMTHKRLADSQDYRLIIDNGVGTVGLRALYDTGHHATEVFSGSPVAIVRLGAIEKFLPKSLLSSITQSLDGTNSLKEDALTTALKERFRMIPFKTVSGTGLLPAFRPDKIQLSARENHGDVTGCYVAVCRILGRGEYDAIIGSDMINLLERRDGHAKNISVHI